MNEIIQSLNADKAYNLIVDKLDSWLQTAVQLLPNFTVAVLVLIVFWFLAKLVKRLTERIMHRFSNNKGLISLLSIGYSLYSRGFNWNFCSAEHSPVR
jgi:small conductance mechanosensitive channel